LPQRNIAAKDGAMTTPPISIALDARADLGEGPRWHAAERKLYWVDILRCELHRLDPETGRDEVRVFDQPIGCFAFRRAGGLLLAMKDGLATLSDWDASPEPFGEQIFADRPDLRFNDGRTDPAGRFWVGSVNMAKSAQDAALYQVDPDGSITEIEGGMTTCNGAAFNTDGTAFHHADTPSHALRGYDVEPSTGALRNRRIIHQFEHGTGRPDGGSFDADGCYWSALFEGGRVVRLSPDGELLQTVDLPISRPTMISFGGQDLRTAFVTTARAGLNEEQLEREPHAGAIFTFRVDVPGLAEVPFSG
jgi:sugar lactone lactonase YvrE